MSACLGCSSEAPPDQLSLRAALGQHELSVPPPGSCPQACHQQAKGPHTQDKAEASASAETNGIYLRTSLFSTAAFFFSLLEHIPAAQSHVQLPGRGR